MHILIKNYFQTQICINRDHVLKANSIEFFQASLYENPFFNYKPFTFLLYVTMTKHFFINDQKKALIFSIRKPMYST